MFIENLFDPVKFRVTVWVVGLLPGLGALKGDVVGFEYLTESFPAHPTVRVSLSVVDELADAPPSEGLTERFGSGLGRRQN
jgi:hypothetical protein